MLLCVLLWKGSLQESTLHALITLNHHIIPVDKSIASLRTLLFFALACTARCTSLPSHGSKSQLSPLTSQPTPARIQFRARTPSTVIIIIIIIAIVMIEMIMIEILLYYLMTYWSCLISNFLKIFKVVC